MKLSGKKNILTATIPLWRISADSEKKCTSLSEIRSSLRLCGVWAMKLNNRKEASGLSRSIINRFFVYLLILFAVMSGGYFVSWIVLTRTIVWSSFSPVYEFFKTLQALAPYIIIVALVAGGIIFMLKAIRKSTGYMDEVVGAAKALSNPDAPPVELSNELLDIQNELNLARARSQENIRLREEAEQRKADMIMYLAHDLKTPLSSVLGYLSLLHDEKEISPELKEKYLSIALGKAERLEDLINEFFEITRFNLSETVLQYSRVNLTRLLEQLVFEFGPMLKEKSLTCSLKAEEDIMLYCDADKIQRVFDNLLRNAVIYSFDGSEINIEAEVAEKNAVIHFRNRGNTIPKEKLARIFEQFYRIDASRSSRGGAGLGLAVARQITELHHGTISAASENETIDFTVSLPLS